MSPISPAVIAGASLTGLSALLGVGVAIHKTPPRPLPPSVALNGNVTHLPPPDGPYKVGVRHLIVDLDWNRYSNPDGDRLKMHPLCKNTEPQLRQQYGEQGALYHREICVGSRRIPISAFYPTCGDPGGNVSFAPVFEPSLLQTIQEQIFGDPKAIHNSLSQAVLNAPLCSSLQGSSHLSLYTPPIGGQRQTFTQLATNIASHGNVALTLDHIFLSGAVELNQGLVLFNMAEEMIKGNEAGLSHLADFFGVVEEMFENENSASWLHVSLAPQILEPQVCFWGYGTGGVVAQELREGKWDYCGGLLSGGVPAPYTEKDVLYREPLNRTRMYVDNILGVEDGLSNMADALNGPILDKWKKLWEGLNQALTDILGLILCHALDACDSLDEAQLAQQ